MNHPEIQVICSRASEFSSDQVDQWQDLYLNSLSPTIYMAPDFVLTALNTFRDDDPLVVGVTKDNHLLGLAILQQKNRSLKFPFRSKELFKTIHSFQSGILLRNGIMDEAVDALLHELIIRGNTNLSFSDFPMSTALADKLIASASRQGFHLFESRRYSRPTFQSFTGYDEWKYARRKMLKESDRQRRRLSELGQLSWRIILPGEVTEDATETFLTLEHNSWKGDCGTSLLSQDQDSDFFRKLIPKLANTGEIFFTELRLNDDAIASTVNFMTGEVAFAYKVAWNRKFSRFGPGILNEIMFIEYAASNPLPFVFIESGTNGDSFIARIWPDRVSMSTGHVISGWRAKLFAVALSAVRRVVRPLPEVHTQRTANAQKN